MKVTGIISTLVIASAASAAAIPRDIGVTSALNAAITKLDSVLGTVEGNVNNAASCLTGPIDLNDLHAQLTSLQAQLGGILPAIPGLPIPVKRADLTGPLSTVNGAVTGVEGEVSNTVGTVEGALSPALGPVTDVAGQVAGPALSSMFC
jgi:hypothetical protein